MNMAEKVLKLIDENKPAACSCHAGYLVRHDGRRVLFVDRGAGPATSTAEAWTTDGRRLSRACYFYSDNSMIEFNWSEKSGARYKIGKAKRMGRALVVGAAQ